MSTLGEWVAVARSVVFSPTAFYRGLSDHVGMRESLIFGTISILIGSLLRLGVMLGLGIRGALGSSIHEVTLTAAVTWLGGVLIMAPLIIVFLAGILHLCVMLLGGRGYVRTVNVVAFATAVSAVIGWIPFISPLVLLYILYVESVGVRELHGFTMMRAVTAVLLPFIIGGVLVAALVFSLLAGTSTAYDVCPQTRPQFDGAPRVVEWGFTETNEIGMTVGTLSESTMELERIQLDYDGDGRPDATFPEKGTYDQEIRWGSRATVTLDTGTQFTSGECASMKMMLEVTKDGSTEQIWGNGSLEAPVP